MSKCIETKTISDLINSTALNFTHNLTNFLQPYFWLSSFVPTGVNISNQTYSTMNNISSSLARHNVTLRFLYTLIIQTWHNYYIHDFCSTTWAELSKFIQAQLATLLINNSRIESSDEWSKSTMKLIYNVLININNQVMQLILSKFRRSKTKKSFKLFFRDFHQ